MTQEKVVPVTEDIEYDTENCDICNTEVAVDPTKNAEILDPNGFVVILGEGNLTHQSNSEGNWTAESKFSFSSDHSRNPEVTGFIVCEDCIQEIHGHDPDGRYFYGRIPNHIGQDTAPPAYITNVILFIAVTSIILAVLIILTQI